MAYSGIASKSRYNSSSVSDGAFRTRGHNRFMVFSLWIIASIIFLWFTYPRALTWITIQLATPLAYIGKWYESSSNVLPTYIRGMEALRRERDALQTELETFNNEHAQYAQLQQEYDAMRVLTEGSAEGEYIVAGVLAAPPYVPYDLLVLDKGIMHGLHEGMYVYSSKTTVLGIIRTTYEDRSVVQLFSSPRTQTTVYIPEGHLFASAEGMGGGVVRVRVPQDVSLSVGALVLLPGIESVRIGTITSLITEPTSPEQSAYITTVAPHAYQFVRIDTRTRIVPTFEELRAILRTYDPQLGDIMLPAAYVKESHVGTTTTSSSTDAHE